MNLIRRPFRRRASACGKRGYAAHIQSSPPAGTSDEGDGLDGRPSRTPRGASWILPFMMIGVGLDARLGLPFGQLRAAAREAERLGFESLWTRPAGCRTRFTSARPGRKTPRCAAGFPSSPGTDVNTAEPGRPGGHAGPAVGGAVRARPRVQRRDHAGGVIREYRLVA